MTRRFSSIAGLMLASVLMFSCSSQLEVTVKTAPPASEPVAAQTYAWITDDPVLIMAGEPHEIRTERNEKRLRNAIDLALQAKGYSMTQRADADLIVAFSVGTDVRYRLEGGTGEPGVSTLAPSERSTKGTANVYLYDRPSGDLVWHSSIWKWIAKGGETDEVLNEGAVKLLAEFPNASAAPATEDAPAEEATEDAPAEEATEDAPAEESSDDAPAEESSE